MIIINAVFMMYLVFKLRKTKAPEFPTTPSALPRVESATSQAEIYLR